MHFSDSNQTHAFIINYEPTEDYIVACALEPDTPYSGNAYYQALDYDGSLDGLNAREPCYTVDVTYCNWGGTTHEAGSKCTAANMWTQTNVVCPEGDINNSIDPPDGPNGGGGTTEGGNDNDGNSTTTNTTDEDCITDVDGNCTDNPVTNINAASINSPKDPCDELNILFETPDYNITPPSVSPKAAIANLKNLISTNVDPNNYQERGYNLLHNANFEGSANWIDNPSARSIRYRFSLNNYGGLHLHPNDGRGHLFFSPEDILNLWRFSSTYNSGTTVDPSLFVHVLVSTKGVYAIKIDNPIVFNQLGAIYNDYNDANGDGVNEVKNFSTPLKNAYEEFIDSNSNFPNGSDSQYQRAFLKFMKTFNSGFGIGVSLYKASDNLSSWSKLTLNENTDEIINTPCDDN